MLQVKNLSIQFGKKLVFSNLNTEFEPGKINVLLGPSGCGKTSLLRALAGLYQLNSGVIKAVDIDRIGMVFQEAQLLPWLNVQKNIMFPSVLAGQKFHSEILTPLLKKLKIEGIDALYPAQLSGGMRMRVSVARALAQLPDLLLLDEPFSALDESTREELQVLLSDYVRSKPKMTCVFVTHSLNEALFIGDHILQISGNGKFQTHLLDHDPGRARTLDYLESKEFLDLKQRWSPVLRKGYGLI